MSEFRDTPADFQEPVPIELFHLQALKAAGAHLVFCRGRTKGNTSYSSAKQAIKGGWQKTKPSVSDALNWVQVGGWLGLIPASVGAWVMDVDEYEQGSLTDALDVLWYEHALDQALNFSRSSTFDKVHIILPLFNKEPIPNKKVHYRGVRYDRRGHSGYVILWDVEAWMKVVDKGYIG